MAAVGARSIDFGTDPINQQSGSLSFATSAP